MPFTLAIGKPGFSPPCPLVDVDSHELAFEGLDDLQHLVVTDLLGLDTHPAKSVPPLPFRKAFWLAPSRSSGLADRARRGGSVDQSRGEVRLRNLHLKD
jgi:hypothetical protein